MFRNHRHGLGLRRQTLTSATVTSIRASPKADKNGVWLKSWGEPGDSTWPIQHAANIGVDARDNVYVADRGNRRIQVFDTDGKFLRKSPSTLRSAPARVPPSAIAHAKIPAPCPRRSLDHLHHASAEQVLFTSDASPAAFTSSALTANFSACSGKPASNPAISLGSRNACPSENELYVAKS